MPRARTLLSFSALIISVSALAHASVNKIELPVAVDGAYWQSISTEESAVIWLGSNTGHIARTEDAGQSWSITRPAGTNALPITQIKAIDDRQAFALTYGSGSDSRLYHTRNGGFSWSRVHRANGNERLRCFDIMTNGEGWILADSLNNNWHVVRSTNGRRWLDSRSGFDSPVQPGQGAYSASGSCVRYANDTWAMGTAYASPARFAVKTTSGLRFNVHDTPITGANPAVTAIYPLAPNDVLLTGGDLDNTNEEPVIYRWRNQDFELLTPPQLSGTLTYLLMFKDALIVGNESGTAWTDDEGDSWQVLDAPAQQISCNEEHGCFGLSRTGVYHFRVTPSSELE